MDRRSIECNIKVQFHVSHFPAQEIILSHIIMFCIHHHHQQQQHHTSVTAAALAASPSASRVQDRVACTSVARWSGSHVPRCRLLSDIGRRLLRLLLVPRTHNKLGDRSFSVAGPRPSTQTAATGTVLRLLQTISEISSIWRLKHLVTLLNLEAIQMNLSVYVSIYLSIYLSIIIIIIILFVYKARIQTGLGLTRLIISTYSGLSKLRSIMCIA